MFAPLILSLRDAFTFSLTPTGIRKTVQVKILFRVSSTCLHELDLHSITLTSASCREGTACVTMTPGNAVPISLYCQFAELFSYDHPVTLERLCETLHWPLPLPTNQQQVSMFEDLYEAIGLYLWLR